MVISYKCVYKPPSEGLCGRAVNISNSGSGDSEFKPGRSGCLLRQEKLYFTSSLFTQVCRCVTVTYQWGWLLSHSEDSVTILLGMLHANETAKSSGPLGISLVYALPTFTFISHFTKKINRKQNNNNNKIKHGTYQGSSWSHKSHLHKYRNWERYNFHGQSNCWVVHRKLQTPTKQ